MLDGTKPYQNPNKNALKMREIIMSKQAKLHPKEQLHPIDAYYQCLLSCKINPSSGSWIGLEEDCEKRCIQQHLKANFM